MTMVRLPSDDATASHTQPSQDSNQGANADMHYCPGMARVLPMGHRVIYPIHGLDGDYFTPDYQRLYNISIIPMGFQNGAVPYDEEQFLLPIKPKTIDDALKTTVPWTDKSLMTDLEPLESLTITSSNYTNASHVWRCIGSYLFHYGNNESRQTVIGNFTSWKTFDGDNDTVRRRGDNGREWQAEMHFRHCLPGTCEPDPEKPHINCFLADNVPLQSDELSLSEIQTILWVSAESAGQEMYLHHYIIPVTLVSCSGRQVRITQGIVDYETESVQIRKSEIVDFSTGILNNWENFLTVLCWLIGEPVGRTTW